MKYIITVSNTCSGSSSLVKVIDEPITREQAIVAGRDFEDHANEVNGDPLNSYKLLRILNADSGEYIYFYEPEYDATIKEEIGTRMNMTKSKEEWKKIDLFAGSIAKPE